MPVEWNLREAAVHYKNMGAPNDQSALTAFLREIQEEKGGAIPGFLLPQAAEYLGTKETYLLAVIKRLPSLRLGDQKPVLELCAGPNCPKRANLAGFVEKTYGSKPEKFILRYCGCMRQCGKGPNLRWNGKVYNGADEALIRKLVEEL